VDLSHADSPRPAVDQHDAFAGAPSSPYQNTGARGAAWSPLVDSAPAIVDPLLIDPLPAESLPSGQRRRRRMLLPRGSNIGANQKLVLRIKRFRLFAIDRRIVIRMVSRSVMLSLSI
jgi:hypothetical protein